MIVKTVIDYLSGVLDAPVYEELAPAPPARCVLVQQTGSSVQDHICTTTLAVQSYAATSYGAADLNERVKAAMPGLLARGDVSRVHLETDYSFNDTARKRQRYQAVYEITHY